MSLIANGKILGASAVITCYCSSEVNITVVFPEVRAVCPRCQSILEIDWKLTVAVDMIEESQKYLYEIYDRWKHRRLT